MEPAQERNVGLKGLSKNPVKPPTSLMEALINQCKGVEEEFTNKRIFDLLNLVTQAPRFSLYQTPLRSKDILKFIIKFPYKRERRGVNIWNR